MTGQETLFNPLIKKALDLLEKQAREQGPHWFELKMKNPDRTIDKETWKKCSSWLRKIRNKVEAELKKNNIVYARVTDQS